MTDRPSVIQYGFRSLPILTEPIVIDAANWLNRVYYRIRLSSSNQVGAGLFGAQTSSYDVDFNIGELEGPELSTVLLLIFSDIFSICRRNSIAPVGNSHVRVIFESRELNRSANFERLDFSNPAETLEQLTTEINNLLQSNEKLLAADDLRITFMSYNGRPKKKGKRCLD